jgi:small subunit ribosomal protein S6
MNQRQYELVYIVSPEATEQQVTDLHTQIEDIVGRYGAVLERTENWGRRKLAYEIERHKEGTYVLEVINGGGDVVKEIDRRLKVSELVIRHTVVRVDEELRVAQRTIARRQADAQRRGKPVAVAGAAAHEAAEGAAPESADVEAPEPVVAAREGGEEEEQPAEPGQAEA